MNVLFVVYLMTPLVAQTKHFGRNPLKEATTWGHCVHTGEYVKTDLRLGRRGEKPYAALLLLEGLLQRA
jgi:hypothetical protein